MNNVILVGRLAQEPLEETMKGNIKSVIVILAVNRNFKNSDGIYETDFIRCELWNSVASITNEYCHTGDVLGVKGRLQSNTWEDENGKMHYDMKVVAERVTMLSSNKKQFSR